MEKIYIYQIRTGKNRDITFRLKIYCIDFIVVKLNIYNHHQQMFVFQKLIQNLICNFPRKFYRFINSNYFNPIQWHKVSYFAESASRQEWGWLPAAYSSFIIKMAMRLYIGNETWENKSFDKLYIMHKENLVITSSKQMRTKKLYFLII